MLTVSDIEAVLNRGNGSYFPGPLELLNAHFRQADVPNLAYLLQFGECANRVLDWHRWIYTVQLVKVDPFQL